MSEARVGLVPRLRRWAITRLRASRWWPIGTPDRRSDVERLGRPVSQPVMLYFGTGQDSLYQVRPWFPALRALDAAHPVIAVFRDSRTAAVVRRESGLDCLTVARYGELDEVLAVSEVKLALYVNHDPANFEALRFTSLVHVYLGHGDSDKGVSVSNQVKAYDFCFLAGRGALDRTTANVMLYDAAARSVLIGQPQLDGDRVEGSADPGGRTTVVYAPTWEASQPSVSYGSLLSHGEAIVRSLADTHRVIYRPHPLSGVIDPEYAAADAHLRDLAERVDTEVPIEQSFADADLLITDISAVALSWLPSAKPLIVCRPSVPYPSSRLMSVVPVLDAEDDIAAVVGRHLTQDPTRDARLELVEYYLTTNEPGVATANFVRACADAIELRDRAWAEARSRGATGP